MLPDFLVIGPGKSGTTWMYHALKQHPQICVSSAKETLFFETEFERGLDWYSGFFSHCGKNAEAVGEVSNTYIFCNEAPERIKSVNQDMKLISCLRNPIERTFSHYLFLVRCGQVTGSFRETLERQPHLIEKGKYFKNLKPYFETFDNRQIHVSLFDELKNDQTAFIQSIYHFLGVDEQFVPVVEEENRLSAAKPRNRWMALAAKKGARLMRRLGRPEVISKIKYNSGITKWLYKEYDKDEKPEISPEDKTFLRDRFANDIKQLSQVLHKNLEDQWLQDG